MLTLQFIPYSEIDGLTSDQRIKKLLDIVREQKIVLLQGRLKPEEEIQLIQKTVEKIKGKFKGIELCTVYPSSKKDKLLLQKLKTLLTRLLLGDEGGITIIGPASIIKEIKRDPEKIQLLTKG